MTGKSVPSATPETRQYWEHTAQGEIWMPKCDDHGWVFPPRPHCPTCGKRPLDWKQLSGTGTVASFIISHRAGVGYQDEVPYFIIIVDTAEGPRMVGNLYGVPVAPDSVTIGMPVEVFFEDREGVHVPQWRPVGSTVTL